MTILQFYVKNVYGKDTYYLVESQLDAPYIYQLTGRKSLTVSDMKALKGLGFKLAMVMNPKNLSMYQYAN
jgi:hypothetical protein